MLQVLAQNVVSFFAGKKAFRGLLIAKGDGIYSMVQNFAEFKHFEGIEPQRLMDSKLAIKAMTSDTKLMKIFYYESITKVA